MDAGVPGLRSAAADGEPGRPSHATESRWRAGPLIRVGCRRADRLRPLLTDKQDLAAQRHTLRQLGVSDDRVYLDHGMTGRDRRRPGLQQALAAVRRGDTLVVPKLDRLARSVPDARAIGDSLTAGGVRLSIGGTVYDPTDPMGKMFFNIAAITRLAREGARLGAIARVSARRVAPGGRLG